jgi:hypothetical protein
MNNPLDVKEHYELDLCPETTMPFKHLYMAHAFFPKRSRNHYQGLRHTLSEIGTKHYAQLHPLSGPSRNRLQTEGSEKSALSPSPVKFCILISKIC